MAKFDELFEPGNSDERKDPDYGEKATEKLGLSLAEYPVELLLSLRAEIDAALPPMKLSAVDLEQELMLQFMTAKSLQTQTLAQQFTEANKKAQVVNTTASTLQALIKMQADFHTAERFKKIEVILIECLRAMPEEMTKKFFERYERELGAMR